MSTMQSPPPGFWLASDGNWYPPQPAPPTSGYSLGPNGRWYPPEAAYVSDTQASPGRVEVPNVGILNTIAATRSARPKSFLPFQLVLIGWGVVVLFGIVGAVMSFSVGQTEHAYARTHPYAGPAPYLASLGDGGTILGLAVAGGASLGALAEIERRR